MNACKVPQRNGPAPLLRWLRVLSCTVALLGASAACRAEMLLSQTTLVVGSQTTTTTFVATGAGTVTAQLRDLSWPERLASLSFAITNSTTVLARSALSSGTSDFSTLSFAVSGPGTYTAIVSGAVSPANVLQLGSYSLQIELAPSAVPIPATGLLLATALASLLLIHLWRGRPAAFGAMAPA